MDCVSCAEIFPDLQYKLPCLHDVCVPEFASRPICPVCQNSFKMDDIINVTSYTMTKITDETKRFITASNERFISLHRAHHTRLEMQDERVMREIKRLIIIKSRRRYLQERLEQLIKSERKASDLLISDSVIEIAHYSDHMPTPIYEHIIARIHVLKKIMNSM